MKISIVTPVFNDKHRLKEYFKRLEKQTIRPEIVIVDGHSKDGTKEFVKNYQKKHKNVKFYLETGRYTSPANARNIGVKKANGEVAILLDVDGWLANNVVENLQKEFSRRKENIISFPHEPLKIKFKSLIQEAYWYRDAPRIRNGRWFVFKKKLMPKLDPSLGYGEDKLIEKKRRQLKKKYPAFSSKLKMKTVQEGPVDLNEVCKRYIWYGRTGIFYYNKSNDKVHLAKMILSLLSIICFPLILIPSIRGFFYALKIFREYPKGIILIPLLELWTFPAMALGFLQYLVGKSKNYRGH